MVTKKKVYNGDTCNFYKPIGQSRECTIRARMFLPSLIFVSKVSCIIEEYDTARWSSCVGPCLQC